MATDQKEKVKKLTEKLHDGIKELYDSDKYRDYLQTMAKFTNYSFNNTILIWAQRPDTMAVAGFRAWETKFHRKVVKGAKGIMIIEPAPWKRAIQEAVRDEEGEPLLDLEGNEVTREVEKTFQSFKVGYVFAYEDTEGEPLPSIVSILDKEVENFDTLMGVIHKISPVPIRFEEINGGENGYYDLVGQEICVDSRLPQLQKIKTSIHEISHGLLHDKVNGEDPEATRNEREVCAESVAFVVCSYLGLDTSDYSFGYVGGWSSGKELKELQQKMEIIRKTANTIITAIETELMQQTLTETQTEEQQERIPEITVAVIQQEKPQRQKSISHRRRCG